MYVAFLLLITTLASPPQSRFTRLLPDRRSGASRRFGGGKRVVSAFNGGLCARRQRNGNRPALGTTARLVHRYLGNGIEVHAQRREPGQLVVVLGLRSRFGYVRFWLAKLVSGQLVEFPRNPVHVFDVGLRSLLLRFSPRAPTGHAGGSG